MPIGRLSLALVVALALAFGTASGPPLPSSASPSLARPFSAVPLNPDAVKALKAKGKSLPNPFPNSANRGRKFNPTGDLVPALTTAAEQRVLVLFVQFSTPPPGGPDARLGLADYFNTMLFGTVYNPPAYTDWGATHPGVSYPTDRTLKNYFSQVSYGKVDVVTLNMPSSLGWMTAPQAYDYYCKPDGIHDYGFGPHPNDASGLVLDAVKAADAVVNFSDYAVGGTVPNLFVVHAGSGAEWNGDPNLIWSHSWSLADAMQNDNGYKADGVWISNYAMMPEVGGDTTAFMGRKTGPYPPTVGVYAHEYGHVLGLPDQYDYGYESEGTGKLSLMAGGSWNLWPYYAFFYGNSPAHLDAWSKFRLGFVTPVVVNEDDVVDVSLSPVETHKDIYKMVVPYSGGREYFLFENRQRIGFDEGLVYGGPGPSGTGLYALHGLAVYHVDDGVLTRNYWRPNEAENWKEFRSEGWRKAWTGETHYGISLLQADDGWHLEHGSNAGDPGDLYPGWYGVKSFGNESAPNSSSYFFWAGSAPKFGFSGVTATNITEASGSVAVKLWFEPWR